MQQKMLINNELYLEFFGTIFENNTNMADYTRKELGMTSGMIDTFGFGYHGFCDSAYLFTTNRGVVNHGCFEAFPCQRNDIYKTMMR